jgi:hypothetical protein
MAGEVKLLRAYMTDLCGDSLKERDRHWLQHRVLELLDIVEAELGKRQSTEGRAQIGGDAERRAENVPERGEAQGGGGPGSLVYGGG